MPTNVKLQAIVILVDDDNTAVEEDPSDLRVVVRMANRLRCQCLDLWSYLCLGTKLRNFLQIPLRCIPISDDAQAAQMKWTDWLLLLKLCNSEGVLSC